MREILFRGKPLGDLHGKFIYGSLGVLDTDLCAIYHCFEFKDDEMELVYINKERGYEVVNTLFTDEWYSDKAMEERGVVNIPLCFLAKSLENMSKCHAAYFCRGWKQARGCQIEHAAAVAYGLEIIYEEDDE